MPNRELSQEPLVPVNPIETLRHGTLEDILRYEAAGFDFTQVSTSHSYNDTFLHLATGPVDGLRKVKHFIEEKGANPHLLNGHHETPLYEAMRCGSLDTVKYFVEEQRADLNHVSATIPGGPQDGYTPFESMIGQAFVDHLAKFEYLIQAGVDIERQNPYGRTALRLAVVQMGSPHQKAIAQQHLRCLLRHGAVIPPDLETICRPFLNAEKGLFFLLGTHRTAGANSPISASACRLVDDVLGEVIKDLMRPGI